MTYLMRGLAARDASSVLSLTSNPSCNVNQLDFLACYVLIRLTQSGLAHEENYLYPSIGFCNDRRFVHRILFLKLIWRIIQPRV